MKIKPMVAGITTIAVPQTRLQRKFAKEGVIVLNLFYTVYYNFNLRSLSWKADQNYISNEKKFLREGKYNI